MKLWRPSGVLSESTEKSNEAYMRYLAIRQPDCLDNFRGLRLAVAKLAAGITIELVIPCHGDVYVISQ